MAQFDGHGRGRTESNHKGKEKDKNDSSQPEACRGTEELERDLDIYIQKGTRTKRLHLPWPRRVSEHYSRKTVDEQFRSTCKKLGIEGASTHSFRRSALTAASSAGIPVRHIQALSGHASLDMLQRYIDVSDSQKKAVSMAFG